MNRIRGLDTIRFVCAFWVVMAHNGKPPILTGLEKTELWQQILWGLYGTSVSGVAAVMAFFVLSGFCIHYPFVNSDRVDIVPFFIRRYLRVCVPMAVVLTGAVLFRFAPATAVFWSVICELFYYTLYPVLLRAKSRWGWNRVLAVASVIAGAILLSNPRAQDYHQNGLLLTCLLGLPCWLLGCKLAEVNFSQVPQPSSATVFRWRCLIIVASSAACFLRFRTPVGYPWTLTLLAPLIYFWLLKEIKHYQINSPLTWFEKAGVWSYSLYIVHIPAFHLFKKAVALPLNFGPWATWIFGMLGSLFAAYVFYLAVEHPSHLAAKRLALRKKVPTGPLTRNQPEFPTATILPGS